MNRSRTLVAVLIFCAAFFVSLFGVAAEKVASKPSASPTKQLTEFVASKGVKTCLKRMEQVNNFVVKNHSAGAYIFLPSKNVNKNIISTSLEAYSPNNTNVASYYASTSVVPTSSNDCGIVYDTVSYRTQSCDNLKKTDYAKYKASGKLAKNIHILTRDENQPNTRTFLMPAGAGCVVINKETISVN
jgi:hypothetical protein